MVITKTCAVAFVFALFLFGDSHQDRGDKSLTKKTDSGLEVTLIKVDLVHERDEMNNVPIYRMGSCPPGAAGNGMKVLANAGTQVYVVRIGIKVLPDYKGGGVMLPTITDTEDKTYSSKNTMLPASLPGELSKLKATNQQLECEFPFEVRFGKLLKELKYDAITFEIKPHIEPASKP